MELKEQIKKCTEIQGLSASEGGVSAYLKQALSKLGIQSYIDENYNVHGVIQSEEPKAKTIVLEAHLDQIGLMVEGIEKSGFLRFVNLGGVDERILCGMEVEVLCQPPVRGVISAITPENKEEGTPKTAKLSELRIDLGMVSDSVRNRIRPGDGILICGETTELLNDRMSGAAMDNRAGVAAILDCLETIQGKKSPYHIHILFSVQEELGLHGATTGLSDIEADAAIVVDVTHGETPDTKDEVGVFPLGSGAVICRGPNLDYTMTKELISLAKEKGIAYAIEVASGGSGTTAWAIQTLGKGIPVMLVSIPLRYMHTNVEVLAAEDVQSVSALLSAAVMGGITLD